MNTMSGGLPGVDRQCELGLKLVGVVDHGLRQTSGRDNFLLQMGAKMLWMEKTSLGLVSLKPCSEPQQV